MLFNKDIFINPKFPKFRKPGNDLDEVVSEVLDDQAGESASGSSTARAFRRARAQCFDYMCSNEDLNTFATFTVDPKEFDRYSYEDIVLYLGQWLDNRVRRKGLKYILVPERHKDGAIHFHGVMNREALSLKESGYMKRGKYTVSANSEKRPGDQIIYNLLDLRLGFSTCIDISGEDSRIKVSKYIWKYMGKQGGQKIGGRYYLHGGDLREPLFRFFAVDFNTAPGDGFEICDGLSCKLYAL